MSSSGKFGTFGGVFTPSILTILGVIMYMRLPMIVGQAGLGLTLVIIVVAHIISFTTGLSVASIATDKHVGAGGSYFIISRSLGLPIGGTLGLALFVGLSFSISLYLIGFSESFLGYWGFETNLTNIRIAGLAALLMVTILTIISTSLAVKTQYFIMAAIILSLASVLLGPAGPVSTPTLTPATGASFAALFGIFFPAVTGFEAGVSMSGDLRDPRRSIPSGTLLAILVGFIVYVGLAFFFAYYVAGEGLRDDPTILAQISYFSPVLMAGIWGATISSALGSILGAPRILQAISMDKILPDFFAKGHGPAAEPRRALILTALLALGGILIGELDVIARIVSMFFITAYGILNVVSSVESWVSPDFRPAFKVPRWVSIVGAATCFVVMIQLDLLAFLGATLVMFVLLTLLKRRELQLEGGDVWSGVWSSLVRRGLLQLNRVRIHQRNWRPNVILFSGERSARPAMFNLARSLIERRGMITSFDLIETSRPRQRNHQIQEPDDTEHKEEGVLYRHIETNDIFQEMEAIAGHYGFAGFDPNTVMLGRTHRVQNHERFIKLIQNVTRMNYNILLYDESRPPEPEEHAGVDIWWSGQGGNFGLILALVRFLQLSDAYRELPFRFLIQLRSPLQEERVRRRLRRILFDNRLIGSVHVFQCNPTGTYVDLILKQSADARLVILGLPDFDRGKAGIALEQMDCFSRELDRVLWIRASSYFESHIIVEPESQNPVDSMQASGDRSSGTPAWPENAELRAHLEALFRNPGFGEFRTHSVWTRMRATLANIETVVHALVSVDRTTIGSEILERSSELVDPKSTAAREHPANQTQLDFAEAGQCVFSIHQQLGELHDFLLRHAADVTEEWPGEIDFMDRLIRDLPAVIRVKRPYEYFQSSAADTFRMRLYKFWKRSTVLYRNRRIKQTLRYRDLVAGLLYPLRRDAFQRELQETYRLHYGFINRLENIYVRLDEALAGAMIFNRVDRSELNALTTEMKECGQYMLTVGDNLRLMHEAWRIDLVERLAELLGDDYGAVSGRYIPTQKQTRPRKAREELVHALRNMVSAYAHNIRLLAEQYQLEGELGFERQRLRGVLQRHFVQEKQFRYQALDTTLSTADREKRGATVLDYIRQSDHQAEPGVAEWVREIVNLIADFPESRRLIHKNGLESLEGGALETFESEKLALRSYIEMIHETRLLGDLRELEHRWTADLDGIHQSIRELYQLSTGIPLTEENFGGQTHVEAYPVSPERLRADAMPDRDNLSMLRGKMRQYQTNLEERLRAILRAAFPMLYVMRMSSELEGLGNLSLGMAKRRYLNRFERISQAGRNAVIRLIEQIIYKRSQAEVLATRLRDESGPANLKSALLDLKLRSNEAAVRLERMPLRYRQVFPGKMLYQKSLLIEEASKSARLPDLGQLLHSDRTELVGVCGPRNSGKSWLCQQLAEQSFERFRILQCFPERSDVGQIDWRAPLRKVLPTGSGNDEPRLPEHCILVLNDLEYFWERGFGGHQPLREFLDWAVSQGSHRLVLFNFNPYFRKFINHLLPLEELTTMTIDMVPFNARTLGAMIRRRHQLCNLNIQGGMRAPGPLSVIRQALLFHRLFRYSRGRPGVALQAWALGVRRHQDRHVQIESKFWADISSLFLLSDEWQALALQLVLHKKCHRSQLTGLPGVADDWAATLEQMRRLGCVLETDHIFEIHPLLQPQLEELFIAKGYL